MFLNTLLSVALAGPEGAQVVNGQVSIQQSAYNTTITASDKAIINYSSFDIARPEIVQFIQPASSASVLNRILSANPTNINGTLLANGRVFFVNPAGVYIGAGARVNVNQLVASGLNITNSDFINGRFNFEGGNGSVINGGDISAEKVYLIGKQVANSGSIHCPAGYVVMAAGDRVFLSEPGSDVMVEIDPQTSSDPAALADSGPGVLSQGEVDAAGGRIVLAAGDIHTQSISNVGSLAASIEIDGAGQISNTGTIEARSDTATGGTIIAKAAEVTNSGTVDVTGGEGGEVTMEATGRLGQFGTIHADGTDSHGGSVELTAGDVVALSSDSLTTANARTNGDGGEVIVYSPDTALFHDGATIEAKGGSESGDGGFIEVSGKKHVEIFGQVDASSTSGAAGTFLIDPTDITIAAAPAVEDIGDDGDGTFTSNANTNIILDTTIEGYLDAGTNVTLDTSDYDASEPYAGPGGGDITVSAAIDSSAGLDNGDVTLTLYAADDITVNAAIDGSGLGTNSKLNVDLHANQVLANPTDDGNTSAGNVGIHDTITTNGGSFTSSGVDFDNTGGEITTGGGNVNLDGHSGSINIGASIVADTGDISAISGSSVLVRTQASGITAGNVDIETTGSFICEPGSRITAGGDGTDLNVNAADIILNAYGIGNETLTNTGNGTITLTASGDTFLADHSINIDEGTLNIKSANIRPSPLDEPMMSLSQKVENNPNIMAAADTGSEIKANGVVSLTAGVIGDGKNPLDLDGATALEITATGVGGIWIRENASTIKSTAITVDEPARGYIYIDYAEKDGNDDAVSVGFDASGHYIEADLDNDSDSSFSYSVRSGDIILGDVEGPVEDPPIKMGENGDVTLSTPDDIVFPDWWEEWPLIITAGGSVSLTADAIYGYIYNGSPLTAPLGIQGAIALTLTDTGSGPMWLAEVGGSTIGSTSITVGDIGYGTIDIAYDDERSWVDIDNDHFINSVVLQSSFSYTATKGDISIGSIDMFSEFPGNVDIFAGGAIRDAVDDAFEPGLDVVCATINLTAVEGGIGTPVSFMDDDVFFVEDRVLEVTTSRELYADTTADGGDILISSLSDLPLGLVVAGTGNVTLVSVGAIRDAVDDSDEPIVDVVGATINLTARQGGIGTEMLVADNGVSPENRVLEVAASRELNAYTSADNGDILISSLSDLPLGLVDAGTGDVTLVSVGAIRDAVDDLDEPIVDAVGATINLTARQGGIGTEVLIADNGVFPENRVLEIAASRELNANTVTGDDPDILIDSVGNLPVGLVDAGTGEVTLNATGAIRDAVDDLDESNFDVVGATINLTAQAGGIGTAGSALEDGVLAENGVLKVTASRELNADTTADGGHILINSRGDLPVGLVDAGAGDVTLNSTGAITEAVDNPEATDIRAGSVQLSAATAITGNSPIETSARSITARTDEGDIDIDNDNTLPITASLEVSTGAGNIKFRQTGGGALTAQEATTQDGTIHIEVDSAELTAGNITAGGQGNIIVRADGDVKVGNVTALDNQITINSAGAIKESVNDRDVDLTAASLALTAKDGIGIHRSGESLDIKIPVPIETDAASIVAQTEDNAESSSHIFINVQNTEYTLLEASTVGTGSSIAFRQADGGELTLGALHTSDGSITVGADGDVKVGSITAFDNQITIDSAGAIDDAAVDVVTDFTAETLTLTAYDGIGATAEIETDVSSLSAHSIASDIMIVEKDTTSLDRIILIDVDTIDGRINITVEEAVGATGDTVLTAVDADGDDDEDEVVITAAAGDIIIGEVSADNVSLEATQGSINDASDDTITDITGDLLMLTARDEIGGSPTAGTTTDTHGAIEVASTGLDVSVNTAGDIVLTESDGTELTDVDTAGGSIDIVSTTGDLTVGDIDATTTVSLEATTGSINDAADDTIVDITANVLTLTARDEIGVDPTSGFTNTAIETTVASLDASSNTSGDIDITETDSVILQDIQTTNGNITLQATGGAMTHQIGKTITANGGSLTMRQRDSLDLKDFTFSNQVSTDLTAQSYNGSFTADNTKVANAADNWKSITAASDSGITLQGSGDITTNALTSTNGDIAVESATGAVVMNDTVKTNEGGGVMVTAQDNVTAQAITSEAQTVTTNSNIEIRSYSGDLNINNNLKANGGGVKLVADNGKIFSSGDTLNVDIIGTSNGTTGVTLPAGSGKAAIVILSKSEDLKLGSSATLTANGSYDDSVFDDRASVSFLLPPPPTYEAGDPIDVAIYLGSFNHDISSPGGGNVTVDSTVSMPAYGTMVIDAYDTVHSFGSNFTDSAPWSDITNSLEVVSRKTYTLDEAVNYRTLPHAKEVRQGKAPSWFGGSKYILRGKTVAEGLTNVEPPPVDSDKEDQQQMSEHFEGEVLEELPLVRYTRDGNLKRVEPNMFLRYGDKIETAANSTAIIKFPNGSEIFMQPETCITIQNPGIFEWFGRIIGRITGKGRSKDEEKFEINTHHTTTIVEDGSEFNHRYNKDYEELILDVFAGSARIESRRKFWRPVFVEAKRRATMFWPTVRPFIEMLPD